MTDFLITFSVDGQQAIRMLEQLSQRATSVAQQINAISSRGTGGNILGLSPTSINATTSAIARLETRLASMQAMRLAGAQLSPKVPTSAGSLGTEAKITQALANEYAKIAGASAQAARGMSLSAGSAATWAAQASSAGRRSAELSAQAQILSLRAKEAAQSLDQGTQSFGRHARRIAEGILVYEAWAKAAQGAASAVKLIVDVERESRRFELATGLGAEAAADSFGRLFDIAVDTVTPIEGLVGAADSVAFAFQDIEDPMKRAAAVEQLLAAAGKVTSVSQRDVAIEADNLIAIMKQANLTLPQMETLLDQVTVASGGTSKGFQTIVDGLRVTAQSAETAGITLPTLIALIKEFALATGKTGSEVGSTFKTLFATILNDPRAAEGFQSITNGLLSIKDSEGNLRSVTAIFADLAELQERNLIDVKKLDQLFTELAPPLNPGAKSDLAIFYDTFRKLGPVVEDVLGAPPTALEEAVQKINDSVGQRFLRLIEQAKRAMYDLFGPAILAIASSFLEVVTFLGTLLSGIPAPAIQAAAAILGMAAALKAVAFAAKGIAALTGISALVSGFKVAAAEAKIAAVEAQQLSLGLAGVGPAGVTAAAGAEVATSKIKLLGLALLRTGLLAIAFAAIELFGQMSEQVDQFKAKIGSDLVGKSLDELKAFRQELVDEFEKLRTNFVGPLTDALEIPAMGSLAESIGEVDRLIKIVEEGGPNAKVALDQLSAGFNGVGDSAFDIEAAYQEIIDNWEKATQEALNNANSLQSMTEEQRIAERSTELLTSLIDEQGDALLKLNDRLRTGKITQAEWATGQDQIARAAAAASQLVGAVGEELRGMIPELASAGEGTEGLAAALFDLFLQAGDNIDVIEAVVAQIVKQAGASTAASFATKAWSDEMNRAALLSIAARGGISGIVNMMKIFTGGALGAAAATQVWLAQLAKLALMKVLTQGSFSGVNDLFRALTLLRTGTASAGTDISKLLAQISGAFRSGVSTPFGTGGTGGSSTLGGSSVSQIPVLDIGDLSASQITKLIAIATTLRNAIPGETEASRDSIVTLIKDAQFLQNVRGIDDRLLRIALEELTQQMEEANRLKQKENILQNLVVNTGPFSALASQPTTFGVGGTLASGTGLNFDPTKGNFTINVPIELQGLDPAKLQQLVYNIIYKAIADALRL